mmetsp:Transcript_16881/g.24733  ORF Transcript_16881/g.24733 Transcript_16881/m.24733 type:complete len:482 (-) Transcript_16881:47-1492(-)
MSSSGKVIILCSINSEKASESPTLETANSIADQLRTKFHVSNVSIRCVLGGGGDRLLSIVQAQESSCTLFGILSDESNNGGCEGIIDTLNAHSPHPYLKLNGCTKNAALEMAKFASLFQPASVRMSISSHLKTKRQAVYVQDSELKTMSEYTPLILEKYDTGTQITGEGVSLRNNEDIKPIRGKVRDRYDLNDTTMALVTTDRQSGFDRMLALVPYKGAVLNLTSAFWFEQTKDIIPNHLIDVPHPNVSIVKKCTPFPIEFVVRAYVTGSTSTSIWKNYQNGVRDYCGHALPEGLVKNQKLWKLLLTPTTKEEEHDRPISAASIVSEGWMTQADFDICADAAIAVFQKGQQIAESHGLVLVDTKYEMGKDNTTGEIMMIDEMHTPDSSRYWLASSYEDRIAQGLEPENIDKEFLRLWFRDHCDPYNDDTIPEAPRDLVVELSRRYISLFEMITWQDFQFASHDAEEGIANAISNACAAAKP